MKGGESERDIDSGKGGKKVVPIGSDEDLVAARMIARSMAEQVGFAGTDLVIIATAVSEIARNIIEYATSGEIILSPVNHSGRVGLVVVAWDAGPGIPDVALALQEGYSTGRGLGMGLPGTRRLMDEFEILSEVGRGTTVTITKWCNER